MKRLTAFERELTLFRSHNVQVLGISVDDHRTLEKWADDIGVSFPLLSDQGGGVSKAFNLFDSAQGCSARAIALVEDGKIVLTENVATTEVPESVITWVKSRT